MSVESLANSFCYDCLEKKNNGVFKCEGCQKKFCLKHTNEHRLMLKNELDGLIEEQKAFSKEFKEENFISTKLFDQIDRWEQKSIEQIRQTARILRKQTHEMARQQLGQFDVFSLRFFHFVCFFFLRNDENEIRNI